MAPRFNRNEETVLFNRVANVFIFTYSQYKFVCWFLAFRMLKKVPFSNVKSIQVSCKWFTIKSHLFYISTKQHTHICEKIWANWFLLLSVKLRQSWATIWVTILAFYNSAHHFWLMSVLQLEFQENKCFDFWPIFVLMSQLQKTAFSILLKLSQKWPSLL